ncbi:MAG: galactose-1-phosphate uridylyltransferase [Actinomycetota bacterium]
MSIIRQDLSTKDWTIFSLERAKRPKDFKQKKKAKNETKYVKDCPFCKGNEHMTPRELARIGADGWDVRVVPNKFAALSPSEGVGYAVDRYMKGPYLSMNGVGDHEVIIESPMHNHNLATMDQAEVEKVVMAYKQRFDALSKNENYQLIIIFRNHGSRAGTSLEHPHSQLIATPFVPGYVRDRLYESQRYFDDFGHCVYCDMIEYEKKSKERLIEESDSFIAFAPYASVVPYNIIILPKKHQACFVQADSEMIKGLAHMLKRCLKKLYDVLENPDYNYVLDSSPVDKSGEKHYHWHLEILPRLTTRAGFEIGSGMYINTILPEDCARILRKQAKC